MLVGNGKSIVNGIAIGKIKIYREPERKINEGIIDDPEGYMNSVEEFLNNAGI